MEELSCSSHGWTQAPREVLLMLFKPLPLKDRCQTVSSVCEWWRRVALESEDLLPDLNLNRLPLFSVRSRSLPGGHEGFISQRNSFVAWLKARLPHIRACILQAERWEDDGMSLHLRGLVAQILGPHLRSLKLVSTGNGKVTSMFMAHGGNLRQLSIDFYGANNGLARQLAACSALTTLRLQCSSALGRHEALGALAQLHDLEVVDSDWRRVPAEVVAMPALTRLFLRFADFEGYDWLPAAEAHSGTGLSRSLRSLTLHACQVTHLPEGLFALTGLTSLSLDCNPSLPGLPEALSKLASLERLSLEGCCGVRSLGQGAAALPLRSLSLQGSGVASLAGGRYAATLETILLLHTPPQEEEEFEEGEGGAGAEAPAPGPARAATAAGASAPSAAAKALASALAPAHRLRQVVLCGKPRRGPVWRAAAALFAALPCLERVSAPAVALDCLRSQQP